MRPLPVIALGLLVVGGSSQRGGVDLLVDPVGWVLVLVGLAALPAGPARRLTLALATLAALVSVPTVWPSVRDAAADADPALGWALSLPQAGFGVALAHLLAAAAAADGDASGARHWRTLRAVLVVVLVLPAVVLGADLDGAVPAAAGIAALGLVWTFVLLLAHRNRRWARSAREAATEQ